MPTVMNIPKGNSWLDTVKLKVDCSADLQESWNIYERLREFGTTDVKIEVTTNMRVLDGYDIEEESFEEVGYDLDVVSRFDIIDIE